MEAGRLPGVVKEWNGSWGFVDFEDGRRAYVHTSFCGGVPLVVGQQVTGIPTPDSKNDGKWQAQSIERVATYAEDNSGRLAGVVSQWNGTYGFINFSDGRRAYVHQSMCGGQVLAEGTAVVGDVVEDPGHPGKWQANNVSISMAGVPPGMLQGTVSEWSRSYGFILFSDGRRAYVHSSQCGNLRLTSGQTVFGYISEDPRNPGKWQATDIQVQTPKGLVGGASQALPGKAAGVEAWSGGSASGGAVSSRARATPSGLEGEVSEWNGTYGFANFSDGRRAYVHSSQTGSQVLSVGQAITAELAEDPRNPGKWQAVNVQVVTGRRQVSLSQSPDGRLVGTVIQWNEKGYGFAEMQDGRRVYVHHSFCGGHHLAEGLQISCLVVPDSQNPGKWQAQQVVLVGQVARLRGTVTSWSDKGFGFGDFEDGRHAYLHKSQCENEHLVQGETISAVLVPDSQNAGKWQAQEILRGHTAAGSSSHIVGGSLAPSAPARLSGMVATWSEKGFGFADFEDGRRAYVHNSFCGGEHLTQGETITAVLVPDSQNPGKWQATQVGRAGQVPTYTPKRPAAALNPPAPPPAVRPPAAMPHPLSASIAPADASGSQEGVVTQWSEKGYGFADFQDGRRGFIHASFCAGEHLTQGERISAHLVPDSNKPGKWQAQQVIRLGKPVPGTVSDWKVEGGYGFVSLEDGRRAYIHRTAIGGTGDLTVGTQVHVTLKADTRNPGKWCVHQIVDTETLAAAAAVATGADPSSMLWTTPGLTDLGMAPLGSAASFTPSSGVVAEWNPKGFGFITLEDGRRAYVHNSQCAGEHLQVGELVSLSVGPDDRTPGKWQAQNVVRSGVMQEPPPKRVRAA